MKNNNTDHKKQSNVQSYNCLVSLEDIKRNLKRLSSLKPFDCPDCKV